MTAPPPAATDAQRTPEQGRGSWRPGQWRYVFAGAWLLYLLQTARAVHRYQTGWAALLGYALVIAFGACYLAALHSRWAPDPGWLRIGAALVWPLWLAEIPLAHEQSFGMCVFLAVLAMSWTSSRGTAWAVTGLATVVVMTLIAGFGPAFVPSWHAGIQTNWLLTIPLVSLAMGAFFAIVRGNAELAAARVEVARLAAENERNRIARDLHDLLGHSLTTITVKAGLARRLTERGRVERALAEIAEVERLSRRTLADVRAAVAGHRDIRLVNELATARELLRAAGITAELPGSVDIVEPALSELFGWVVREGVTNVVRHARAARCTIVLGRGSIEISDNGRGGRADAGGGSGLAGLRERVAAGGGTLRAGSTGQGWRLRVDVPAVPAPARTERAGEPPAPGAIAAPTIEA